MIGGIFIITEMFSKFLVGPFRKMMKICLGKKMKGATKNKYLNV
jgi:hypothetical protein